MERPVPRHKGVYILPNLFTTASLFAGFMALVWAADGLYEQSAIAVFVSALMDGLDGKVARLTGTASEFGVQYDSLADLVAFGLTPGFMIFHMALAQYDRFGIAVAFLFTVCAALRLARFNVSSPTTAAISKRFFIGLPTPAAGCTLASLVLFMPHLPEVLQRNFSIIALITTLGLAILMVSRIRYAAFKEFGFFKAHPFSTMISAILLFALIVTNPKLFGFLIFLGYIISGLVYTFIILPRMARAANRAHGHESSKEG